MMHSASFRLSGRTFPRCAQVAAGHFRRLRDVEQAEKCRGRIGQRPVLGKPALILRVVEDERHQEVVCAVWG